MSVGIGIVGCGLIGQKRAKALGAGRLVACASRNLQNARRMAVGASGCAALQDWRDLVRLPSVAIVIVATSNDLLAEVSIGALENGKHVLVEKPASRSAAELSSVIRAAEDRGLLVRVAFNHRYHPAVRKARQMFCSGAIGEVLMVRARYGHGGRLGYDREWRADPALSGGGVLVDLGVHVIDLARLFLGELIYVAGHTATYFWDMPVEDNAFLLLRNVKGNAAFLHVSCTEWKNMFSLEVYGNKGKLQVDGLGGSYGPEQLSHYNMLPEMGPPETTIYEFPGSDDSWNVEFAEFLEDVAMGRLPAANLYDARAAFELIKNVYAAESRGGD